MKIHEYQAKGVLKQFGIPVPNGIPAVSVDELPSVLSRLPEGPWVVKAQVHTGGRGKAGGILKASTPTEAESAARSLFGKKLVTHQTGPQGIVVKKIYFEQIQTIARELYLACVLDRSKGKPVLMASTQGGMEIEVLAKEQPDAIAYQPVDPWTGLQAFEARAFAQRLGLTGAAINSFSSVAQGVAKAFLGTDASMVEVNPLGLTAEGKAIAMDAKISFDDNALYRHPDLEKLRDRSEENPLDVRASETGVNYIALDGNIGCMVNGAGLAMGTMDLIKHHGGDPANFLDVGGGANTKQVTEAFKILLSDSKVKAVLVNIFGGIMKCDVIAEGIVVAAKETSFSLPLVVRLEGTNVERGRQILKESGLAITAVRDLTEAAEKVVAAVR